MPPIVLDGTTGITTPGLTNTGTETLVNLTTTGNTILGDASTDTLNVGNGGLVKDASGNVGVGVTPSAWNTFSSVLQVPGGAIAGIDASQVGLWQNAYYNSGYKYKSTAAATFYQQSGASHIWYNAPSGTAGNAITFTQAMTLDASGNLGIGTTSPSNRLHVTGSNGDVVRFAGAAKNLYLSLDTSGYGLLSGSGQTGSGFYVNDTSSYVSIYTNSAERARIDSSGNLLVGATSTSGLITSSHNFVGKVASDYSVGFNSTFSTAGQNYGIAVKYTVATPNNTSSEFFYCADSTAQRVRFVSNGGLYNYSANNSNLSDSREKINVSFAGDYLAKICAIPVRTYNYIDQNLEEDDGLTLGVFAQDVQAVAPELVTESNWAKEGDEPKMRLSIYQTDMQYALMKCIQEQQALITQLTARITALESA